MFKHNKGPFVKPNFHKISQLKEEDVDDDENIREVIVEHKSGFNTLEVLIIVVISIAFGVVVGCSLSIFRENYQNMNLSEPVKEMIAVYQNILDTYYKDVDGNDLSDAAINGMISSLDDPYSVYMDEDDSDVFNTTVDGSYVGIGVTVVASDTSDFIVIEVLDNSPAQKAGIEVGDVITEIDSKSVIGLTLDDISSLIKGKSGSKIKLTLLRGEDTLTKTVTRGNVELVSVVSKKYDNNIGYIYIQNFAANTYQQFKKELNKLEKQGITSLIIDVRSNPGGHLNQTKDILELFMDKNKVLYQVEFKEDKEKIKDETKASRDYPVVVLINSSSASASEILAASFQDSYSQATLVGETTYGKGTVQQAYSLTDGSSLKYTTERWLTPKGKWIDGKGVSPDYEVSLSDDYLNNPIEDNDSQLQKALKLLKNS